MERQPIYEPHSGFLTLAQHTAEAVYLAERLRRMARMMAAAMMRTARAIGLIGMKGACAFAVCLDLLMEDCFAVARLSDWVD